MTLAVYVLFMVLTALERLAEVRVSLKNASWSFARGGREVGQGHYPAMVVLQPVLV